MNSSISISKVVVIAAVLWLSAFSAAAQSGSIDGRVVLPNGASLNESARIILQSSRGIKANIFTDNQGRFQFRSLTPGLYEVVVEATDKSSFETTSSNVEVFSRSPAIVTIVLREKSPARRSAGGSVSTTELDPAVPVRAKTEFDRASDAIKEGKTEEAVAHLRKAIELYPGYLKAHNDLGTQLLAQGKLDEAVDELLRAIEIDSKAFNPKLNLGIVLVQQHKFSEAAAVLKEAISLDSASPSARLYNGIALEGLDNLAEAERELKTAHDLGGSAYALALFHLGNIHLTRGDRGKAVEAFERYLVEAPQATNAASVRALLGTIR